ncbi:amidase signature enzyme [Neoconidiobolus thromboides FSU 785]|nr:amidase signature enzyme [Neoconidiobolus thromboides FSU 785]
MDSISDIDLELSQLNGIDIRETSIENIHGYYKAKKFTCKELVEYYLKRIEKLNPYLNTVIEVNKEAIKKAEELDQLFNEKGLVGSLFGIPILAKDNIATYDTMQTTCGSMALYDVKPKEDATVIKLIRAENAIILGKVNMTEFAGFRDEIDPLGWSARGGQTCNPYVLSKHASGSSSGSAASVAANLAVVSLGTETDGSITAPSSTCSLVGLKPTVGLTSRAGVIPLSHNQDSVSCFVLK